MGFGHLINKLKVNLKNIHLLQGSQTLKKVGLVAEDSSQPGIY